MNPAQQIRLLIRETLLQEFKEHTDDELVDFAQIDLQHEFNKLNSLLFNNELKPIPMKWNTRKASHGIVNFIMDRTTGIIKINYLAMSQFLHISYKNFKNTLAHEMIHVELLQKNIREGHGWQFQQEMRRINGMGLGFNVTIVSDDINFEINKDLASKAKEMVVAVMDMDNRKNNIAVMAPSVYESQHVAMEELFGRIVKSGKYRTVNITYIKVVDPELMKYPSQRSMSRGVSLSAVSEEFVQKLKSEGKIMGLVEITQNEISRAA